VSWDDRMDDSRVVAAWSWMVEGSSSQDGRLPECKFDAMLCGMNCSDFFVRKMVILLETSGICRSWWLVVEAIMSFPGSGGPMR
jgi:hypothetical protein